VAGAVLNPEVWAWNSPVCWGAAAPNNEVLGCPNAVACGFWPNWPNPVPEEKLLPNPALGWPNPGVFEPPNISYERLYKISGNFDQFFAPQFLVTVFSAFSIDILSVS
jgi:hypothetical protein